jgi:hypothetical protein
MCGIDTHFYKDQLSELSFESTALALSWQVTVG